MVKSRTVRPRKSAACREQLPWWIDVDAARQAALTDRKPCVLILNSDSRAL
jgi:hypothetical protein